MTQPISTLARVRASYSSEKAWHEMSGELPAYLLYRPLSFWLTVPLVRIGAAPWQVTALSGLIALSLPALALRDPQRAYLPIALLTFLFHVLDCVDGNLARTRGRTSARGALLDALVDQIFWCCLFLALGVMVGRSAHPLAPYALPIALGCAVMVLAGRRIRDEAHKLSGRRVESPAQRPAHLSLWDWLVVLFSGLENLYGVAILIGGYHGALAGVLCAIAGYVTLIYLASVALSLLHVRS